MADKSLVDYMLSPDFDIYTEKLFGNYTEVKNNGAVMYVYLTSNEYLDLYFKQLNLKGKRIATVGSSGDQFYTALLHDCKDVTIIDANCLTKPFVEYKTALIKTLPYAEFINTISTRKLFNWKTYRKISHLLPKKEQQFWDNIMLMQEEYVVDTTNLEHMPFNDMALLTEFCHEYDPRCNFYFDESKYKKLQNELNMGNYKLTYINARLEEFNEKLENRYDVILLSNIRDYMRAPGQSMAFDQSVQAMYDDKLNPGGHIQVDYAWTLNGLKLGKWWRNSHEEMNRIGGHKVDIKELNHPNGQSNAAFFIFKSKTPSEPIRQV